MKRKNYSSDLTDLQWKRIRGYFGWTRKRQVDLRQVWNAILHVLNNGTKWRELPSDFPAWQTVYSYFYNWKLDGSLSRALRALTIEARKAMGRHGSPSVLIVDAQSVKIRVQGWREAVGYDGGKSIKGRKRSVLVDTQGFLWGIDIRAANESDIRAAKEGLLSQADEQILQRLLKLYADQGYDKPSFIQWVENQAKEQAKAAGEEQGRWELEIVKRQGKGFSVQPKRWIVERSLGWTSQVRRLDSDYERTCRMSEAFIEARFIQLTVRKLVKYLEKSK